MQIIYTGLSSDGRKKLTEFLQSVIRMDMWEMIRPEAFETDIDFERDIGFLEISGRYTESGNPVTTTFSRDAMLCEMCVEEGDDCDLPDGTVLADGSMIRRVCE